MSIFKAYDIRGIVPTELDADMAYRIGVAAARFFKAERFVVGTDVRDSRDMMFDAFTRALRDHGVDVVNIGTVSTPILYYTAASEGFDAGVMITASHNPKEYNGFKFCRRDAAPVPSNELQEIRKLAEEAPVRKPSGEPGEISTHDPLPAYRQHVYKSVRFQKPVRVVLDTANAVCGSYLADLYSDVPLDIIPLFFDVNSQFPNHAPNPLLEENLQDLKAAVNEHGAVLGAALDGDGDRVIFVDENAQTVPGDLTTVLLALALLEEGERDFNVIIDCRSSKVVEQVLEARGLTVTRSRVGHTYIKKTMREQNTLCAGELSGHYYFQDSHYTENPDTALFRILNLMEQTGKSLSELVAPLQMYHQSGEINFVVEDVQARLKALENAFADQKQEWIDGLTIDAGSWWCNVRPSNTEPVLRLNLEADNPELLQGALAQVKGIIES